MGGVEVEVNLLLSLEIDINVSVKNVPRRLLYPLQCLLLLYIYLQDDSTTGAWLNRNEFNPELWRTLFLPMCQTWAIYKYNN